MDASLRRRTERLEDEEMMALAVLAVLVIVGSKKGR